MSSENSVMQNVHSENENKNKNKPKQGLKVMGYVIPWWAVALIVLLVLYLAYDKGLLDDFLKENNSSDSGKKIQEVALAGPVKLAIPVDTPVEITKMKNMFGARNMW